MTKYGKTKRGGRVSKYYKAPAPKRKFGNNLFNYEQSGRNKKEAQNTAQRLRKRGFRARVVYTADKWRVYTHAKRKR